ncbi:MAG TPA: DoxX family protein [Jatrophihabitans sp.]
MNKDSIDTSGDVRAVKQPRFSNSWPTLPLRIFLAVLFLFAGYAKLSYPGFFSANSPTGFKATIESAKIDSPIKSLLGPLSDHYSVFGHISAFAEIAIGLGLLVGLLTRIAALGAIVLMVSIALSINYDGIKQYTGSSGWFTSVDFAVAAALTVFLIGGAGPLSLDGLIRAWRARRREADDLEPGFDDYRVEDSRARLRGEDTAIYQPADSSPQAGAVGAFPSRGVSEGDTTEHRTEQLPRPTERPTPEPEPGSLWTQGRRDPSE